MKTIEEYIELSKSMKSTSKGGSDSYLFLEDQVVLVKYTNLNKYGMAREMEEEVAVAANHKYEQGINTPAHIAWYRCKDEKSNYCYVLQQQAKGKCLVDYKAPYGDIKANIEGIKWINTIPEQHIEKAIRDLIQIFNMGLELKPKNLFYDEKYGYTFIDLLNSMGVNAENYAQYLINQYQRYGDALAKAQKPNEINLETLTSHSEWKTEYLDLLDDIAIGAGDTIESIIAKLKAVYENLPEN